jgi:2-haloacid dehalogenase
MTLDRRTCLKAMAGGLTTEVVTPEPTARPGARIRAVTFDAFAVFDPRPIQALARATFPEQGDELIKVWRTRQFEYQWLRALGGRYADFRQTTEDALDFAARTIGIDLPRAQRDRLMGSYLQLKAWPDVEPALRELRREGLRLALLSNATPEILNAAIANSALRWAFDQVLSTDRLKTYKPDPRAYQMGVDAFGVGREEIAFVAFAGWDATGARWFGYPTYWANRTMSAEEGLGAAPDGTGRDLTGLAAFLRARAPGTSKGESISR